MRLSAVPLLLLLTLQLAVPALFTSPNVTPKQNVTEFTSTNKRYGVYLLPDLSGEIESITDETHVRNSDIRILFDLAHNQWWDDTKLSKFIDMLSSFGLVTLHRHGSLNKSLLEEYDLVVIPNPKTTLNETELSSLWWFLEEKGGSILLMGDYSYRGRVFGNATILNSITDRYGITWFEGEIRDDVVNYEGRNWQVRLRVTDEARKHICPGVEEIYFIGTALNLSKPSVPCERIVIARGNPNTTYFTYANDTPAPDLVGSSVIAIVAVELNSGGRLLVSGSSAMFSNYEGYAVDNRYPVDINRDFIQRVIAWLLHYELVPLASIEKSALLFGEETNITVVLANIGRENFSVTIALVLPYTLNVTGVAFVFLPNGTVNTVPVAANGTITGIPAVAGTQVIVKIPVRVVVGREYSGQIAIRVFFRGKILELRLDVTTHPAFTLFARFPSIFLNTSITNMTTLHITVINNASWNITNLTLHVRSNSPWIVFAPNSTTINSIPVGRSVNLTVNVTVLRDGVYTAIVEAFSEVGGFSVVRIPLIAFPRKIIVFDNAHNQYFDYRKMEGLIAILSEFAPVLVNFNPFTSVSYVLDYTALVVIPNPEPTGNTIFFPGEIELLVKFVEEGGALLLMGNFYRYFYTEEEGYSNTLNALGRYFGVRWYDGDVYDSKYYVSRYYYVISKTFANNSLAKRVTAGIGEVYFSGTHLECYNNTERGIECYPIVLGNPGTTNGTAIIGEKEVPVKNGSDVILVCAVVVRRGSVEGRVIATGSTYMFASYGMKFIERNAEFARRLIAWLVRIPKLKIVVSVPPSPMYTGQEAPLTCVIINIGEVEIYDIVIEVEVRGAIRLARGVPRYSRSSIKPGEQVNVTWTVKAVRTGTGVIRLKFTFSNYPPDERYYYLDVVQPPKPKIPWWAIATGVIVAIIAAIVAYVVIVARRARRAS